MNRLPDKIQKTIPGELVPAVEALCKSLDDAHFRCGKVAEVFCFSLLHPGEKLSEVQEHRQALGQFKAIVGQLVTQSCDQYIRTGTAPAFFHAMFEMYKAGLAVQAVRVFHDLLEIGKTHEGLLAKPPIQWAHDLALELVGIYEYRAKFWIRAVCDPPDYDTDLNWDDPDEIIMGKHWCAPLLIVMRPSRNMPFDETRQWERADRETTKGWLNSFAKFFTIHIKLHIDRLADEKTVELAKKPKPTASPGAEMGEGAVRQSKQSRNARKMHRTNAEMKRLGIVFGAIQARFKGMRYCAELDKRKLRLPDDWTDEGCPNTYALAYKDPRWRKRIQDEKHRHKREYDKTSAGERESIIEGQSGTRLARE